MNTDSYWGQKINTGCRESSAVIKIASFLLHVLYEHKKTRGHVQGTYMNTNKWIQGFWDTNY